MKIVIISNMYPDERHPSYGVFVKNFCNILDTLQINYLLRVMQKSDSKLGKLVGYLKFYLGTTMFLLFKEYDLIYVHYASHSSIPVLIANKLRKKDIFTNVHGSDVVPENSKQKRMQKYTRKILSISKKIIVPSEYFKNLVEKKYNIAEDRVFVSPSGGIDEKVFYKEKDKERSNVIKLGYVGRISHKKGWDTLLKACSKLTIPYELIVVGNGPEYKQMRKFANDLKVDKNIKWVDLQTQDKLREFYNDFDVFIFPTERKGESLGLVAIEAMACGTPVIASDYAAPMYYVEDDVNGLKFECGNSKKLSEAITKFYNKDFEERLRMEDNCIKKASGYSVHSISKDVMKILGQNNG